MTCIDGVILGNSFTNILGVDVSKDWRIPDLTKNPILNEVKKYMHNMEQNHFC